MMEAARTSETLVNFYQTTRCYNPEDSNLHLDFVTLIISDEKYADYEASHYVILFSCQVPFPQLIWCDYGKSFSVFLSQSTSRSTSRYLTRAVENWLLNKL
jgi:hypothetical protein